MKSIVQELKQNGTWENKETHQVFFKWEYVMENGDMGGCLTKTNEPRHKVGDEVEYEIEEKNGHLNIKFPSSKTVQYQRAKNPEDEARRQLMIIRQSSLKAATDLVIAQYIPLDSILICADVFTEWVNGNIKAESFMKMRNENELPF